MEKKIYREKEDGTWENVSKLIFPDGQIMDEDNHDFERDGYFYAETPPQKYLDWKEQNEELT